MSRPIDHWRKTWPILSKKDVDIINNLPNFNGIVTPGMDWLDGWTVDESWEYAIAALVAARLGFLVEANEAIIEAQRFENGELGSI